MPNVEKIRGLNLPGTPRATSACRGMPLLFFTFSNLELLFVFQLSVEDFSWQDEAGEGAFPNLENISNESDRLTYLPFVHAPLRAFHHHLPMQGQNWHNVKLAPNGLLSDAAMNETLLFLNLDDATSNEDRPGLLKRHGKLFVQPSDLVDEFTYSVEQSPS